MKRDRKNNELLLLMLLVHEKADDDMLAIGACMRAAEDAVGASECTSKRN